MQQRRAQKELAAGDYVLTTFPTSYFTKGDLVGASPFGYRDFLLSLCTKFECGKYVKSEGELIESCVGERVCMPFIGF